MATALTTRLHEVAADNGTHALLLVAPILLVGGWAVGRLGFAAVYVALTTTTRVTGVLWRTRNRTPT
ncbi:MAG: hypothetical protein R2733_14110 [Acidimicrobiales bacterium]